MRATLASATEPITLIPLAPLTNVAVLVRSYPELLDRLDRIVLMGGAAAVGNATAAAEFNVWHDPEAAAIVLDCGVAVTMYGLDVFYAPALGADTVAALAGADDPAVNLAGRLLEHQLARFGGEPVTIGDAGAVAAVLRPDLIETQRHPVRVELGRHLDARPHRRRPASARDRSRSRRARCRRPGRRRAPRRRAGRSRGCSSTSLRGV